MASLSVCVFCASSNHVDPTFFAAARAFGSALARRGHALVYGGTTVGLMGAVAGAAHAGGGRVVGIMPEAFTTQNMTFEAADELVITADLRARKAAMEARADAFVALPGGFGTLEEVFEILTLKQLLFHVKPVVFLNTGGFYDHLLEFFARLQSEQFTRPDTDRLYSVADTPDDALDYLERYVPESQPGKWF